MNHIQSGTVSDPFAFIITDQNHSFPFLFRNINHAFFTRQVGGNLGQCIRLTDFPFMFGYGSCLNFFRWFWRFLFGKKRWGIILRNIMFRFGTEHLAS